MRVQSPAAILLILTIILPGCIDGDATGRAQRLQVHEALLWGHPYPDLRVVVRFAEDREPNPSVMDQLVQDLRQLTDKVVVSLEGPKVLDGHEPDPDRVWTADSIRAFQEERRETHDDRVSDGPLSIIHVLYLDGRLEDDDGWALGMAMENTIVIAPDSLRLSIQQAPATPERDERIERAVVRHELGHVLGLVGCGAPMLRPRSDGGCHSTNEQSVMHAAVDTSLSGFLMDLADEGSVIVQDFDEDDLADLRAERERGRQAGSTGA